MVVRRYGEGVDAETLAVGFVVLGVLLCALELVVPGLVVLPFGLAAVVAGIAGFIGADPLIQAIIFIVASAGLFLALRPLAHRLNQSGPSEGIGSQRLINATGVVLEHIAAGETGLVRIDREEWRAESGDGRVLVPGKPIRVREVVGTRVVVLPAQGSPADLPSHPPVSPDRPTPAE